ncbi:hypothetical protein [Namhaeicola litoreus]|uniref:Uncharacterized protein n=1 Tax=Namhaeicola litoreus TaxID=1052145 RepID=A0ABW3Y391_9FLAO
MYKTKFYVVIAVFMAMLFGQNIQAQTYTEEIDMFQSIFGMEKKELVSDFLQDAANDDFWTLYDEYELKRKSLGKERLQALTNYANNYDSMDLTGYDNTIKEMIRLRSANDKLIDSYYKKIKKKSGSKAAAQFFQIESYILSESRSAILEGIPFIGELN